MTDERPVKDVGDMLEIEGRSGISPGAVIMIIAVALLGIFVAQITKDVQVSYLGFNLTMSLWLLTLIIFGLGMLVGYGVKTKRVRDKRKAAAAKVG